MIFFVNTETRKKYEAVFHGKVKMTLENLSGDICLMVHYADLSQTLIDRHKPWAIVYSGRGSAYDADPVLDTTAFQDIILNTHVPQLGICGGHQIIASYYDSTIGAIRKLRDSDPDNNPDYNPGYFKEKGMYSIDIISDDPLFEGMGQHIRVTQSHYWEIKELAPRLKIIASNIDVRAQAYTDPDRCLYGVQFHPERYTEEYPDGRTLLRNFFTIAQEYGGYRPDR